MTIDWSAVALGQTLFLAVAVAVGLVCSVVLSIASALGGNRRHGGEAGGPHEFVRWAGVFTAAIYLAGTLLFWSLRVGWAIHQGTLFTAAAG